VPRKNNRREDATDLDEAQARARAQLAVPRSQSGPDGDWSVRLIGADAATKTYRCPGCDHEIGPRVAHIVAWPSDERGDAADRRHWHTACWNARSRRGPTGRRP